MTDLFDVFLSFNSNFVVEVKHNGDKIDVIFALKDKEEATPPVIIKIDKGESPNPEEIQALIKAELGKVAEGIAPFAEQMAALTQSVSKTTKTAASKTAKASGKKDDKKVTDMTTEANKLRANTKSTAEDLGKHIKKMQAYTKEPNKDVTTKIKDAFEIAYMNLNKKYDEIKSDGGLF